MDLVSKQTPSKTTRQQVFPKRFFFSSCDSCVVSLEQCEANPQAPFGDPLQAWYHRGCGSATDLHQLHALAGDGRRGIPLMTEYHPLSSGLDWGRVIPSTTYFGVSVYLRSLGSSCRYEEWRAAERVEDSGPRIRGQTPLPPSASKRVWTRCRWVTEVEAQLQEEDHNVVLLTSETRTCMEQLFGLAYLRSCPFTCTFPVLRRLLSGPLKEDRRHMV